ncbi:MAG: UDP-N-acetylmuramoyl-tripeptide--D-alanyl-D-alanine ligase [Betaproteobacteria bacterium]
MLDLKSAAHAIGATHAGPNRTFIGVTTDSRQVQDGDLFVALRGERFDGHAFVDGAFQMGATGAMVERDFDAAPGIPLIIVEDSLNALGKLSAHWRSRFGLPLVAITGSNGKTTLKEMLAGVLRAAVGDNAVLATIGNLNNDIGMPLMLLRLRDQHHYAVIEMGMNHLGEIHYLTELARPSVAVINNAGIAHIGELGSRDAIAQAKGEIYAGLSDSGIAVINADDDYAQLWRDLNSGRRVVEFGIEQPAEVRAQYELTESGSSITCFTPNGAFQITLQVAGAHNVSNALAAAAVAYALAIAPEHIAAGLAAYAGTKGRLQRKPARGGAVLIDDTYNANPDSVRAAIAVLAALPGKRVLVLGDMGELGSDASALHGEIGEQARNAGIDRLFTLGDLSAAAARSFGSDAEHFTDVEALYAALDKAIDRDTTMLVKGSRFMRMERVVERFMNGAPQSADRSH